MQQMNSRVEWLILADAAQVVNSKLYLMGGGWDALNVTQPFPIQIQMGIAMSVLVPWLNSGQQQNFELDIASDDGASLAKVAGTFGASRSPDVMTGLPMRTQVAVALSMRIEKPGSYYVAAIIGGQEQARTFFSVLEANPGQRSA